MDEITHQLERQGVKKFADSFVSLLKTIELRAAKARREVRAIQPRVQETLERLDRDEAARRLWGRDATLWPGQPAGWLGWLELPERAAREIDDIQDFARQVVQDGFTDVVLLGMGGSSLAAEVLRRWSTTEPRLKTTVLDSIEPTAVRRVAGEVSRPVFVVASKSGTTLEPLSLMGHFWEKHGGNGDSFVAITDPGTPLEALARERGFRKVFLAPVDVGGRYSALSVFGLVPAGLAGVDLAVLAEGASAMARQSGPQVEAARNPGLFLGAVLAAGWQEGRDKVTLIADPPYEPLLGWIEQLLAESSGKDGKGLFPVVGEPVGPGSRYAPDRLMVYLRSDGSQDERVERWVKAGIPVSIISVQDGVRGLGAEFFRWEVATAVACNRMGVNAFDQPDVQRAKEAARRALQGRVAGRPLVRKGAASHDPPAEAVDLDKTVAAALAALRAGDAFVVLAFLPQTPAMERSLASLRRHVRDRLGNATLVGFGPRYLHSTGQLFKGGPDRIVALVVHAPSGVDVDVPDAGYTLGDLLQAQALGDVEAMRSLGRRVFFIALDSPRRMSDLKAAVEAGTRNAGKPARRAR
jgi:transaldolase/glucose-6-phosphate isomerase